MTRAFYFMVEKRFSDCPRISSRDVFYHHVLFLSLSLPLSLSLSPKRDMCPTFLHFFSKPSYSSLLTMGFIFPLMDQTCIMLMFGQIEKANQPPLPTLFMYFITPFQGLFYSPYFRSSFFLNFFVFVIWFETNR